MEVEDMVIRLNCLEVAVEVGIQDEMSYNRTEREMHRSRGRQQKGDGGEGQEGK